MLDKNRLTYLCKVSDFYNRSCPKSIPAVLLQKLCFYLTDGIYQIRLKYISSVCQMISISKLEISPKTLQKFSKQPGDLGYTIIFSLKLSLQRRSTTGDPKPSIVAETSKLNLWPENIYSTRTLRLSIIQLRSRSKILLIWKGIAVRAPGNVRFGLLWIFFSIFDQNRVDNF